MKTLAVLAIAALPALAVAGGAFDGVYFCNTNTGTATYVTVNGQQNGTAILAIPYLVPNQTAYGYGIGAIDSSGNFTGSTMFGLPMSLRFNGTFVGGTLGLRTAAGTSYTASVSCNKVF